MHVFKLKIKNFAGGACPQTPLEGLRAYGARHSGKMSDHCWELCYGPAELVVGNEANCHVL